MFEVRTTFIILVFCLFADPLRADGQELVRNIPVADRGRVEIVNPNGRVEVTALKAADDGAAAVSVTLRAGSPSPIDASYIAVTSTVNSTKIEVKTKNRNQRIDLVITIPEEIVLKIETEAGEVLLSGKILSADVRTDTGTIAADVPPENIRYLLRWTASRPRFVSDFELEKVRERSAGRFEIAGIHQEKAEIDVSPPAAQGNGSSDPRSNELTSGGEPARAASQPINLKFETSRGIILLNVPPGEVSSDLRERPLTNAAKAIIRSGDSLLMEAIRRAAPRYYGDYLRTLPPLKVEPRLAESPRPARFAEASVKVATVRVSDQNNRAITGLAAQDFEVIEGGVKREVLSVRPLESSFNLVLLLDVSGSIENYVDFIRKAARSFVNTVDARDRIAIVTFGEDVEQIAEFSTDKKKLSESLDTFDAGGPTAFYDSLAYVLADTLRPLKGERTAIVVLTDGDDNRSFLAFDSMLSSIQESGALIYPLYVPSGLIEASHASAMPGGRVEDSLRRRYLQGELTSKAKGEGARLAEVSGGVYYQIDQLSQIDKAYEDIVGQLRTAYEIEYRSELGGVDSGTSPRVRIRSLRPNSYVHVRSVIPK
ncbi:MAG: VWA domain-containing protein [Chloracidobacterium sp.]|nr:VWA domain-containing protein [Chloracidobacterium sp.]